MAKTTKEQENQYAQAYIDFVIEKLKNKIEDYLQVDNVNKDDILQRMKETRELYSELFNIQYNLSRVSPENILEYKHPEKGDQRSPAYNIDTQAKNWLNRLSTILNVLTIKASEFSENEAKKRERTIFAASIIISALIGVLTTWGFDKDDDLKIQKNGIIAHQDSLINEMKEFILNLDNLKQITTDSTLTKK